jgi:pimeloyl-ACP methyl ester carboxylesterase
VTPQEESVQKAADRGLAAACEEHGGPILDHMSTANAARDLDRLRVAVGDSRLNYLGLSYGSYLGVTYANLFPGKVRALVVDGVLDPIAWSTGRAQEARTQPFSTRLRSDEGAQRTLEEFFRLCDETGAPNCAFAGNSAQRFATLAKQLLAEPLQITDPASGERFPLTYADLIVTTLTVLYAPVVWPEFASLLADAARQTTPATLGRRLGHLRSGLGLDAAAQGTTPTSSNAGRGCPALRQRQPVVVRRLAARRGRRGTRLRLLRAAVDLGLQPLPALARR